MGAPKLQKNFGWLSRKWDVSVNSKVLEVAYNVLPVILGNSLYFWSLWWSWRKIVIIIKDKLDIKLYTHKDRIDGKSIFLNLTNIKGLNIVTIIFAW